MKTIRNTTSTPLRVPLPGGKTLHLGPARSGQIADRAAEHPALRKLAESGKIEFVEGEAAGPGAESQGVRPVHGSTHGHRPPSNVTPKGDR